jgi:4-diphosphocytidyl-2-C-methyl-D-erythritol kinase
MLEINAPAKINLTLEVLSERSDGYHDIRSVIQPVKLCDKITLEQSPDVSISCEMSGWTVEKSLVKQAIDLMWMASDKSRGVNIRLEKNIPLLSGLGGDSSDAAGILDGLNEFWGLELSPERILEMAAQLGSDVYFFLGGGTALVEGRGEVVSMLPHLPRMWVILVMPDVPVELGKTAAMYSKLKPAHFTDGSITQKLVDVIIDGRNIDSSLFFNTFENIAFQDNALLAFKEHLIRLGAPHVHLCGSGSTLYTTMDSQSVAEDIYIRCQDQGMEVCITETI